MASLRNRTKIILATLLLIITLYLLYSYHHHAWLVPNASSKPRPALEILDWKPNAPPRVAIAASSPPNANTRSLALWSTYATHFTHELHIQRTPVMRGFANPLVWLHHTIASELMKDSNSADWIVFIDPSTTLPSSPSLPLSHFLPPPTFPAYPTLTFIGTKSSHNDIDTSLFYICVSALSLRVLTLAMAAVYLDAERDWGEDIAGAALRDVLEREGYRDKVAWVPGEWWDERSGEGAFVKTHVREDGLGLLQREKVLADVEARKDVVGREVVPGKQEVEAFWSLVGEARSVLDAAKDKEDEVVEEIKELRDVVESRTWEIRALLEAIDKLKERLGLGDLIGFESKVE